MKTLHLFAGAGGGLLADIILGHTPAIAVEHDAFCCAVLRERFPSLRVIESDVRTVDFSAMVGIDAICAGFPCQDISVAGAGKGIEGERSGLFREVMRALDDIRPTWVFLENSPNIRTKGRHVVIGELVARGYSWRDGVFAASDCGAPHIRKRWFCLARLADASGRRLRGTEGREVEQSRGAKTVCASSDGSDANCMRQLQPQGSEQDQRGRSGNICEEVADSDQERLSKRQGGTERERSENQQDGRQSTLHMPAGNGISPRKPKGYWDFEPGMDRVANGIPNRTHRIKALGNAQVPLQAALAWKILSGQ